MLTSPVESQGLWFIGARGGYALRMSGQRSGIGRYAVTISGLVVVLAGVAALGVFLVAAGESLVAQAITLGLTAAACFAVGFVVLTRSAKRRGGLLDAEPTPAERRIYEAQHARFPRLLRRYRRGVDS